VCSNIRKGLLALYYITLHTAKLHSLILLTRLELIMTNDLPDFNDPQMAFENAIEKGIFTEELTDPLDAFVGDWMYMHSDNKKKIDFFKNKWTKKYKEVSYE